MWTHQLSCLRKIAPALACICLCVGASACQNNVSNKGETRNHGSVVQETGQTFYPQAQKNGVTPTPIPTVHTPFSAGSPFISRSGSNLYLNGNQFRFIGVNIDLATVKYPQVGCGKSYSDADVDTVFSQLHQIGITVDRMGLYQSFTKNGTFFDRVDLIVQKAQQYNVHLMISLENQWGNCTQGGFKRASWYQQGYLSPYGNYTLSYKDYVGKMVSRYKNSPNIFAWELMNEPQARNDDGSCNFDALFNFAADMSSYIKSIDPNHMIVIGSMDTCINGSNYAKINSLPKIDLVDDDDYGHDTVPLPSGSPRSAALDLQTAKSIGKPFFIVESGIFGNCTASQQLKYTCYTHQQRADLFKAKFDAEFNNGASGFLIWYYSFNKPLQGHLFDFTDVLSQTIKTYTARFNTGITPVLPTDTSSP